MGYNTYSFEKWQRGDCVRKVDKNGKVYGPHYIAFDYVIENGIHQARLGLQNDKNSIYQGGNSVIEFRCEFISLVLVKEVISQERYFKIGDIVKIKGGNIPFKVHKTDNPHGGREEWVELLFDAENEVRITALPACLLEKWEDDLCLL